MAGYEDTRQMIINTLTNRLAGTEIQPEDHQEFALAITDYVRSVELLSGNAFIGFAEANTTPVQSDKGQCFYISTVRPGQTVNFVNFIDSNGNAISVSSPGGKMSLVTLIWNTQYWSSQIVTMDTNWSIAQQSGNSESMVMSQKAITDELNKKVGNGVLAQTTDIASGAITGPKIAENSITTSNIVDGTIQSTDINSNAFDSTLKNAGKLADAKAVGDAINKLKNAGYLYAGIANPTTNPGTPDGPIFYIALQAGTYSNFGNTEIDNTGIFTWDGTSWSFEKLDFIVDDLIVDDLTTGGRDKVLSAEQGKVLKGLVDNIDIPIVNDLTTGGEGNALSAEMGKELNLDKISKESATTSQYPELTGVGFIDKVWYSNGSQLKSNNSTFTLFVPVEAGEKLTVTGFYYTNVFPVSSTMPSAVGDIADFPNDGTLNGNEITYQHAGYAWLHSTDTIRVTKNKGLIVANKTGGILPPIENTTSYLDGQLITKETMQKGDIMPSLYNLITPSRNLLDPASFDPISYINTSDGKVNKRDGTYGIVVIRNVVLNGSFCFSASQQLLPADSIYNGISIQPSAYTINNTVYAALTGPNFGKTIGKGGELNFTMLPDYNGWKITANIEFPCDIYIGVGDRGANTKMQFEKGDSPTDFVPYGEKMVGTDWSPQISALNQSVVALQAQIDNVKSVPSRWTGSDYTACGDSITDENYEPKRKYCTILAEALACKVYENNGASGSTMAVHDANNNNFVNKMVKINFPLFNLVTIALGTNDFGRSIPIGDETSVSDREFFGAYKKALDYIFNANKTIRVILITPFQCSSQDTENDAGHKLIDYVNAIKRIGQIYSCPVVDFFGEVGINQKNMGTYTLDGLHPNALGQEFAGGYIVSQVKNL